MANKSLLTCQIVCFLQFALNHPFFICRYVDISDDLSAFAKYVLNCFVLLDNCPVYYLLERITRKKKWFAFLIQQVFYSSSWKEAFLSFFRKPSWKSSISTKPLICHFLYTLPFLTHIHLSQYKFSIHVADAALCVALRSFDVALKSFVPLLFFTSLPTVESGGSGSLTRKASFCQEVFWTQYTSPIHDLYTPFLSKLQIPLTISSLFGGENNGWMKKSGLKRLVWGVSYVICSLNTRRSIFELSVAEFWGSLNNIPYDGNFESGP